MPDIINDADVTPVIDDADVTPIQDQDVSPVKNYSPAELGAHTKPEYPGHVFYPSGIVANHLTSKIWLPKAQTWASVTPTGITPDNNLPVKDESEAQTAIEIAKGMPLKDQDKMMSSHGGPTQPGKGTTGVLAEAQKRVLGADTSIGLGDLDPRAIYANMGKGFYDIPANMLGWLGKKQNQLLELGNEIARPLVGGSSPLGVPDENSLLLRGSRWAQKTGQQFQTMAQTGYQPGVMAGVEQLVPQVMAAKTGGPQAGGAIFGTQMGYQAGEQAKAAGASPAKQVAMDVAGTLLGGGFGVLRPGATPTSVTPTVAERASQGAQTSMMLGGMTTGMNLLEKALYNPSKGAFDGVPDQAFIGLLMGVAEANGRPVTESEATILAQYAKENPVAFAKQYRDVLGPAAKKINESTPRNHADVESDIADAARSGDAARIRSLKAEYDALPSKITDDQVEPVTNQSQEPEPVSTKLNRRLDMARGLSEQDESLNGLQANLDALNEQLGSAKDQAANATRNKGEEGRRSAQRQIPKLIDEIESVRAKIEAITGKDTEPSSEELKMGVVDTKSPVFKQWFGNSRIVDESGKPIRVYHGTLDEFGKFEGSDKGYFFTTDPDFASYWARGNGGRIIPAYLRAEKPFDYSSAKDLADYAKTGGEVTDALKDGAFDAIENPDFQKFLRENGYDSYYVKENGAKNIAVFDPSQIKSATSNTGRFGKGGLIADNLGLQQVYESGMRFAKERLGLPESATDGDVVREVMNRIGSLGASVRETAIKIVNKVGGIGRELADAISNHLHEAFSGSRESQTGAVGPDIGPKVTKSETFKRLYPEDYAAHQTKMAETRKWIKDTYDDPEVRKALYNTLLEPFKPPVAPGPTPRPEPPSGQPLNRGGQMAGIAKSVTEVTRAIPEALTSGGEENITRIHAQMKKAGVLQEKYKKGSGEAPTPSVSSISPDAPKVIQDFGGAEKPGAASQLMRSGHNIWERVFGADNPAMNAVLAATHRAKMGHEYYGFMKDITKGIDDSSLAVQKRMKPIFEQFLREKAKLDAHAENKPDETSSPESHDAWQKKQDVLNANFNAVIQQKNTAIRELAKNHADTRIALAAEMTPDKYPTWLKLTPAEEAKAKSLRGFSGKMKQALQSVGIATLGDDQLYVTHMANKLLDKSNTATYDRVKSVLNFKHRESDTGQWLPSVHAFGETYVPSVTHKLAFQPFLNKWGREGGMLDPKNENGLVNPNSPNKADGAAEYLTQMLHGMQNPEERGGLEKMTDIMRDVSGTMLLGMNPRVGYKHLIGKATSISAEHHVWSLPATVGQIQSFLAKRAAANPKFQSLLESAGLNRDGLWEKKSDLISHFVVPREIMNTFKDDPFVAQISSGSVPRNLSPRGREIWAAAKRIYTVARDNPVMAIESWENGLNVMASLSRSRGMDWNKAVEATMQNVLDYNFRGGADAPGIVKNKLARAVVQFVQTPMKSTELKAKLIMNGLRGGEDIYGSNHTAKLVRTAVAYGAVMAAGSKLGINVTDSLLHTGLINQDALHHAGQAALGAAKGDWDEVKDRIAAIYGIHKHEGLFPNAPWMGAFAAPLEMVYKAYAAESGVGEKTKAALNEVPAYKQISPLFGAEVPKPYEGILENITGTQPVENQEKKDVRQIKRGLRELGKLEKKANQ